VSSEKPYKLYGPFDIDSSGRRMIHPAAEEEEVDPSVLDGYSPGIGDGSGVVEGGYVNGIGPEEADALTEEPFDWH